MESKEFAKEWIDAWNAHDLERIISHYADDVVFKSPVIQKLLNDPAGEIVGKSKLRDYFSVGLKNYPNLKFELVNCLEGVGNILLYYKNPLGGHTAESLEFNDEGKVKSVVASYGQ
ncbi:MAG: nuclear transport factor 2 family protein [Ketobacteraceae bacterium]|nr:nuclear transport factor 2 family protein [Ketobacteraceae bacterium]